MDADIQYYNGYNKVVNDYFDLATRKAGKEKLIDFLKRLTPEEKALIAEAVATFDRAFEMQHKLSFPRNLSMDERNQALLKKVEKECGYIPRYFLTNNEPRNAFSLVRYLCFNSDQIKRIDWNWYNFLDSREIDELMEWYTPEWFGDFLRVQLEKRNVTLPYRLILKWRRMGLPVEIPPGDIAPALVFLFQYEPWSSREVPEAIPYITNFIEQYPEILEEIKYLFHYPTSAYYADKNSRLRPDKKTGPITYLFKHYTEQGIFDRMWVIKEAVTACSNNFNNRDAIYWYPELLMAMEPTREELLSLQQELFTGLSCIYTLVPQTLLKLIRKIVDEPHFRVDDFMTHLPALLASDTKSLVKATLPVIDSLFKKYTDKRSRLCEIISILFVHKNEELQQKAAKQMIKYGVSETLKPVLASYSEMLLMSTRTLLKDFLEEDTEKNPDVEQQTESSPLIREDNRIVPIDSIEELVFRLGQAFEDFRHDSIDQIPQALIRFRKEIDADVLQQFSPAVKAAEKVLTKWIRDKRYTDEILAVYFLYFYSIILNKLPQEKSEVKRLKQQFEKLEPVLETWSKKYLRGDENVPYAPMIDILNQFLMIVDQEKELPLLSVPTHEPCRIDPAVFFERLDLYREESLRPSSYDMQVAIQRLDLSQAADALKQVPLHHKGFYEELFTYLFDPQRLPPANPEFPELWLACTFPWYGREIPESLIQYYPNAHISLLTGKFEWETYKKEMSNRMYNYELQKYEEIPFLVPRLIFHYTHCPLQDLENKHYIGAFMWTRYTYYHHHFIGDMSRLLRLFPNNPEVLLGRFICEYAQAFDDGYDYTLISVLEFIRDNNRPVLPMGSLFLALCMIYQGKTTRLYAAEVWADLTAISLIDQEELGRCLGLLLQNGHAPLKRFTDSLFDVMLNRGPIHNRGLQELIKSCLARFDETPLPYLKKLLEAYKELLAKNGSTFTPGDIPMLDKWEEGGLKKLVKEIKQFGK